MKMHGDICIPNHEYKERVGRAEATGTSWTSSMS